MRFCINDHLLHSDILNNMGIACKLFLNLYFTVGGHLDDGIVIVFDSLNRIVLVGVVPSQINSSSYTFANQPTLLIVNPVNGYGFFL